MSLVALTARDVMTAKIVDIAPDDPLSEVLGKMGAHHVHELPVTQKRKVVGMVSYDSLLHRGKISPKTKARDLMISTPQASPTTPLLDLAQQLLEYRAIPVADDRGQLVGIVSRSDIITKMPHTELASTIARTIMTPPPSILEDEPTRKAKRLLSRLGVDRLPVVSTKGKLVGVFGMSDLAPLWKAGRKTQRKGEYAGERAPLDIEVKSLMSSPAITAGPNATVEGVVKLMLHHNISSIIITEHEHPVGIVTTRDILELAIALQDRGKKVHVQITGVEDVERETRTMLDDAVAKTARKLGRMLAPDYLFVHVEQKSGRRRYTARTRLAAHGRCWMSQGDDWDLLRAVTRSLEQLEKMVIRSRERTRERRRR